MNDNNINEEGFDQHQWPPDIPSPDRAWNDMLSKLEKEMPVNAALEQTGKNNHLLNKKLYLILLLLLLNAKHIKESLTIQHATPPPIATLLANTNISKQKEVVDISNKLTETAQEKSMKNHNLKDKQALQQNRTSGYNQASKVTVTITRQKNNSGFKENKSNLQDTTEESTYNVTDVLIEKKPDTQKPKSKTAQPTDSMQNNDENEEKKLNVQAGLQWTLPLPIAGTQYYFSGPTANEQPWRILLPGAWVSVQADKNMLMAEVNPFASASFNPKSFYNSQIADSLAVLEKFKSVTKVFGVSGAISFQHNITGNWWAGAGLQANFWNKGVAVLIEKKHDIVSNTSTSSTEPYVLSKEDWQYFSKFQLYPHLQLMYRGSKYQAGLRTGVTFTSLAKDNGAKNTVFTELFFRLPLISSAK